MTVFLSRRESIEGNIYATAETEEGAFAHVLWWIKIDIDTHVEQSRFPLHAGYFRACRDALTTRDIKKFLPLWNTVSKNFYGVTPLSEPLDRPFEYAAEALRGSLDKLIEECEKADHETLVDDVFKELSKKT